MPRKEMLDATPAHKQRARRSLERHTTRTMGQLIKAGASWRAVGEMRTEGEIVSVGSTPCAKIVYALALTPSERHAHERCQPVAS